jgi:hypothetical protein
MLPEYDFTGAVRGKYAGRITDATEVTVVYKNGRRWTRTMAEVKRELLAKKRT